jgi:protein-disulfide isomerase
LAPFDEEGAQKQFWPFHDLLYQYQSDDLGQTLDSLLALAQKLNLNQEQFKSCLENHEYLNTVKKNMVDSERLGVAGTPSWYINGLAYPSGEIDQAAFEDYLANLLN